MTDEVNKYIRYALIILLIYLSYLVARPYLTIIFTSAALAYMAYPLYGWLKKYLKNEYLTAGILTLGLILIIMIPLGITTNLLFNEASNLYRSTDITNIENIVGETLNIELSEGMKTYIQAATEQINEYMFNQASNFILSIPQIILAFFIMFFVFFYSFKDGEKMLNLLRNGLPIDVKHKKRIEKKFTSTIQSLIYGEIAISILEGIVAIIGFYFLSVSSPIFWGVITGLVALLPAIGPAIIWVPIAVIFYVQGNIIAAVLTALFGFFVLSILFDAIIRTKILGIKGHIHPVIILIGVLGGLASFGLPGLILGPLFLVLLELVIEFYLEGKYETLR